MIETLTITNRGSEKLVLQPATASGQVSILGTNLVPNQTLAPGASYDLQVQINSVASGTRGGVVTISSNDALLPVFEIPISANVLDGVVIDDGDLTGFQLHGRPGWAMAVSLAVMGLGMYVKHTPTRVRRQRIVFPV